ncbi:hypothetical protein ACFX2B_040606 [Malus domestica]
MISLIEQKEEGCRNEEQLALVKQYKSKVETKLSAICAKILELLQSHLVPSATNGESKEGPLTQITQLICGSSECEKAVGSPQQTPSLMTTTPSWDCFQM